MVVGAAKTADTTKERVILEVQDELALTDTLPEVNVEATETVIEVVPAPEVTVIPVGTVHVYEVALVTEAMEYVAVVVPALKQTPDEGPVMAPG